MRELGHRPLLAEKTDEAPHLGERVTPGCLDSLECHSLLLLLGFQEATDSPGLHRHDRDRVGDGIVELTGDPLALFRYRSGCCLDLLALEALRTLGQLSGVLGTTAENEADRPGNGGEQPEEEVVAHALPEANICPHASRLDSDQPEHRTPRLVVRAEAPGHEKDDDQDGGRGIPELLRIGDEGRRDRCRGNEWRGKRVIARQEEGSAPTIAHRT